MKIDKIATAQFSHTQLKPAEQQPSSQTVKNSAINTPSTIDSQLLAQAQQPLNALPDVDMAKVEQIKNALNRGEINLDIEALSSAILQFHTGHE
ncbi:MULTISPECIES: flagellar biosynthesis anti-sigma factor FlgM [unclassified Photobacterium]|uniref:flagellar biosynthesis anti-sigma factor FlgM n=1 Tax=unclassified Photobacterium TaxID=2628852 RepID=UPI000D16E303|nr:MULTISPECIES: flagellar biosynthesis anti-sigma factor FlgM [unclassified Photobacterium]PSV26200.1 flagellar biosynthesis anti-sigma factor FlgM [Photobacterium sp. GB-56]PSV30763.1 flagellar biosynthesis anti-sigma factor FlgM [Photobacterium sp. GB-72]PSV34300.1 flagellar biosynthesis anti-sigma factor FlgM [Photobacterium sp. GB-210]PSV55979.1 flagellar biosynthesis anti-sigma factor FlgM [Photobacterium sp. GB-3]